MRIINQRESVRLASVLTNAVREWAEAWASDGNGGVELNALAARDVVSRCANREWYWMHSAETPLAAVGIAADRHSALLTLLGVESDRADDGKEGDLLASLANRAWDALAAKIIAVAPGAKLARSEWGAEPALEKASVSLNGYFVAHARIGGRLDLAIVLLPGAVQQALGKEAVGRVGGSESLTPMAQALEPERVTLEIVAGTADVPFEDLRTLRVGHVIRLDSRLDEAMEVHLVGDGMIGKGFLGARDGQLAVQLVQSSRTPRGRVQ